MSSRFGSGSLGAGAGLGAGAMGLMGTTLLGVTGEVEAEGVMVVPGEVGLDQHQ